MYPGLCRHGMSCVIEWRRSFANRNDDTSLALNGLTDKGSNVGLADGLLESDEVVERNLVEVGDKRAEAAKAVRNCC